jgi:uncharacterized protein
VNLNSTDHKYQIIFPGGEVIYDPSEGTIIDPVKNRTITLSEKRKFSLLSNRKSDRDILTSGFKPVCLTIYASHRCNLMCKYCYIPHKEKYPDRFIDPATVQAGAQLVAESCRQQNLPFVVGFHGGNEPLLYPHKIENYLKICQLAAKNKNLEFLSFCTTNGVISEDTARWAAKTFYGITLSWDGPQEFHNALRKDKSGNETCSIVERSAGIFSALTGGPEIFLVRCTVTSLSVELMEEIIRYFSMAGVKIVEFYPVFQNRDQTIPKELMPDPGKFVYYFLKARSFGLSRGMRVLFSGSRIMDLHNRFCMIMQDNLTVTPDGYLTNCYHQTWNFDQQMNCFFYGKYHLEHNQMEFDKEILHQIIQQYDSAMINCSNCFNQFHCSQGCPDICPFNDQYNVSVQPDCIREKWLGLAFILEYAGYLKKFDSEPEFFDFFRNISYRRILQE